MANEPQKDIPLGDLATMVSIVVAAFLILVEIGWNVGTLFAH